MSIDVRPRRPLLALLLSLVLPGFGQLYNGQVNRGIWLFLAYGVLVLPGMAWIALGVPSALMMPTLLLALVLVLSLWIYAMVDAWKGARRRPAYVVRVWQTGGLYALVFTLCSFVVLPAVTAYVRQHKVESFRIPAVSMQPTIMRGDFTFADKRYNCPNCKQAVARGDVVVFTFPNNRTLYFAKRIIGLPGEHVAVKGREVFINGQSLKSRASDTRMGHDVVETSGSKRWRVAWLAGEPQWPDMAITVPAGQVFVMGDNRNVSEDSRMFGTVPLQDVVGRVRQVWFSYADGSVRWGRLGQVVE